VSQDTVVMFKETAAGQTPAVHFWYYPGESIGKEFVYPKSQALKIAARTNERVLSTDGEVGAEASVSSVDASGKVTEWTPEKAPAPQPQVSSDRNSVANALPSQEARAQAPAAEPFPQGGAGRSNPAPAPPAPQVTRTEPLPQTASPLALSALIGVLSLAGAAGMRFLR
jgi:hypothetical protein